MNICIKFPIFKKKRIKLYIYITIFSKKKFSSFFVYFCYKFGTF